MTDIFQRITERFKEVGGKGKELIETIKLKGELKDVQHSIDVKFQSLGKKVFEMINRGALNEDELRIDCGEIASLFRKITDLEEAIKQVELESLKMKYGVEIIICPKCGGHNKSDAKFCMSCGSSIVDSKTESKRCPTCNVLVKEEIKFCARCGTKII